MIEVKRKQQRDAFDRDRREALKKLGAIGIAAATAPAMMTLLQATQASAQSTVPPPPNPAPPPPPPPDPPTCCDTYPEHPDCQGPNPTGCSGWGHPSK